MICVGSLHFKDLAAFRIYLIVPLWRSILPGIEDTILQAVREELDTELPPSFRIQVHLPVRLGQ